MFHGDKTIIFHQQLKSESRAEIERNFHNNIKEKNKDPSQYLLSVISSGNAQKESFLEFVASQYFNNNGYLTENQVPYANDKGIPDFAAYRSPLIKTLIDEKFIESACPLPEISTACIFSNNGTSSKTKVDFEVVIGEAKTNNPAIDQLYNNKKIGLASCLFEIFAKQKKHNDFGLLKFDDNYKIDFDDTPKQKVKNKLLKDDEKFFENYVKFYLLGNLPLEKIKAKFVKSQDHESGQLIKNVIKEDFYDVINFVKGEM